MRLSELVEGTRVEAVRGDVEVEIADLAYDSGRVGPGALFFCVRGMSSDGHEFAPDAVARGAAALVVERELDLPVPQVVVSDARAAMGPLAVRFWYAVHDRFRRRERRFVYVGQVLLVHLLDGRLGHFGREHVL